MPMAVAFMGGSNTAQGHLPIGPRKDSNVFEVRGNLKRDSLDDLLPRIGALQLLMYTEIMTRPIQETTNPLKTTMFDEISDFSSISSEELNALKTDDEPGDVFYSVENAVLKALDNIDTSLTADDLT